jgi:hypothetical protein
MKTSIHSKSSEVFVQPSPYTPGEVSRGVPGRTKQLAELEERLSFLVDLRRLVGRIRVDHAPRGYGKTSLLREYQRRSVERGLLVIWVTAGEPVGLIAQIAEEIDRQTASWAATARARIRAVLDSLTVTVGVPGISKVTGTLGGRPVADPPGARAFEDVVRETADHGHGAVFLVDEIQAADPKGIRTLVYAWQHLQAEGSSVPAAVFAAGLPNAPEAIAAIVTFSERIAYRSLGVLSRDAEEIALVAPARALGVIWTPPAIELALSVAQGYPYSLQLIGDSSWTAAGRPDPGGIIDVDEVRHGRLLMQEDLQALFRARWAGCTPAEQRVLRAMAAHRQSPIPRVAIAAALGVSTNQLSTSRARLIDKGLIQPAERGTLEFTIPGFDEFIRQLIS